ncbi:hypothetical protein AURDEDRAFT_168139 [Auricularia subglabra TFB-10046 SS5]|nr:hypothetical protein AURDEDRAFT_168139 [Auricularia subglabra TFB-10046 SS5]
MLLVACRHPRDAQPDSLTLVCKGCSEPRADSAHPSALGAQSRPSLLMCQIPRANKAPDAGIGFYNAPRAQTLRAVSIVAVFESPTRRLVNAPDFEQSHAPDPPAWGLRLSVVLEVSPPLKASLGHDVSTARVRRRRRPRLFDGTSPVKFPALRGVPSATYRTMHPARIISASCILLPSTRLRSRSAACCYTRSQSRITLVESFSGPGPDGVAMEIDQPAALALAASRPARPTAPAHAVDLSLQPGHQDAAVSVSPFAHALAVYPDLTPKLSGSQIYAFPPLMASSSPGGGRTAQQIGLGRAFPSPSSRAHVDLNLPPPPPPRRHIVQADRRCGERRRSMPNPTPFPSLTHRPRHKEYKRRAGRNPSSTTFTHLPHAVVLPFLKPVVALSFIVAHNIDLSLLSLPSPPPRSSSSTWLSSSASSAVHHAAPSLSLPPTLAVARNI